MKAGWKWVIVMVGFWWLGLATVLAEPIPYFEYAGQYGVFSANIAASYSVNGSSGSLYTNSATADTNSANTIPDPPAIAEDKGFYYDYKPFPLEGGEW